MRVIAATRISLRMVLAVYIATILAPFSSAQNQPAPGTGTTGTTDTSPRQSEPKVVIEDRAPGSGLSFLNGLSEMRVPIGFAVGITHTYAPDPYSRAAPDQFTSIS